MRVSTLASVPRLYGQRNVVLACLGEGVEHIAFVGVVGLAVAVHIPCVGRFGLHILTLVQDNQLVAQADGVL